MMKHPEQNTDFPLINKAYLLITNYRLIIQLNIAMKDTSQQEQHNKANNQGKQMYDLLCPQGNLIESLCIRHQCNKTSLHCRKEQCDYCFGLHPYCQIVTISTLQSYLKQHLRGQEKLFQMYYDFEQKMTKKLQQSQRSILKDLQYQSLPNSIRKVFSTIFEVKKFTHLTGMDLQQLKQQLQRYKNIDKQKLINQHCAKFEKTFNSYLQQKMEILSSFEANHHISSKILKQAEVEYVFESLGMPRKLQLLYRGSENHFSAAKFHQKCDEKPHTLTVIRTEFDRKVAGYTPIPWSSPSSWTAFADNEKKSFLLQIDKKQKMTLVEKQYAIYCHQFHGPRFGRADLSITNKCNQNSCTGNLPTSYQTLGTFKTAQEVYQIFSGAQNGFLFRIIEYEVFRIIF